MTPFFQASRRSLAYQFTINAPFMCPTFSIFFFFFKLHFQPCFGQNFSSQDTNFPNFRSQDPSFFREIRSLEPTFGNPCGAHPHTHPPRTHTHTHKVECPLALDKYNIYLFIINYNSIKDFRLNQYWNFQLILPMRFHFMTYFANSIIFRVSLVFVKDSILPDRPTNELQARAWVPNALVFAGGERRAPKVRVFRRRRRDSAKRNFWR